MVKAKSPAIPRSETGRTAVGVVDERDVIREGVAAVLRQSMSRDVRWSVNSLEAALALSQRLPIDAIYLSVDLGGPSFEASVRRLRRSFSGATIVGIVADHRGWSSRKGDTRLLDQIFPVLSSVVGVAGHLGVQERLKPLAESAGSASAELTVRELEVLQLVANARANLSIADSLGIKESTVKRHVTSILTKLRATSRLEAALQARRLGYVHD